jgi:hypothetical protein
MENTNPTQPNQANDNASNDSRYITIEQFLTDSGIALTTAQLADIEPLLQKRGIKKTEVIARQVQFASLAKLNQDQKKEFNYALVPRFVQ